ncbi:MAG: thiamine-phosphate kinase [Deltaproteobacteria bacterium]|nr:thiamine-phosphate kinase [Deltaproteobacteria bacterium]
MPRLTDIFCDFTELDANENYDSLLKQTNKAISKESSCVIYKKENIAAEDLITIKNISDLLKCNNIPFLVYNDIMLAKITCACGIIFDNPQLSIPSIREFLGEYVLIGSRKSCDKIDFAMDDYVKTDKNIKKEIEKPWSNEFLLIKEILTVSKKNMQGNIVIPAGVDDTSLLKDIKKPVISTDTQRENIHFRREWQTPFEIGYKAVVVTLSDLAASFAKPLALFINLSLPKNVSESYVKKLYEGVNEALEKYHCTMGGGNISGGLELSLDLFVIGSGFSQFHPVRGNAKAHDLLCCTGPLGEAKAGLELLGKRSSDNSRLIDRFKKPTARFDVIETLSKNGVRCITDVSDGLLGDAGHIAKASDLTVKFRPESIKISNDLLSYCCDNENKALEYIYTGGEDYELLFACSIDSFEKIKAIEEDVYILGEFIEKREEFFVNIPENLKSFDHGTSSIAHPGK